MSLMGVDVGTTGVKAAVFDESGVLIASAYEEYPLLFPFPGAAELDSRVVVEAALQVIGRAAHEAKCKNPVTVIGIASQGEAYTPLGRDGSILGNAMTSSDTRAADLVRPWSEKFGWERLYRITGHTPYAMYSLYKFLWLKEHEPEIWHIAWKFLFFQDLLAFVLTGEAKTDYTMAARSMLFDVSARKWSSEVLGELDLLEERLPDVVSSGELVGKVRRSIASDLGLSDDVWVAVCGHDQPVGALGCGAASPGMASYSIGTVECICPAIDRFVLSEKLMKGNLATYPHVVPNTYTTVAFNITGGSVLRWVRDNLAVDEAQQARLAGEDPYDSIIAAACSEPSRVIVLPHFGPTGTPHFDACGAGVVFGLRLSTTRGELIRAFLEGITFEMRWNLSILADAGFEFTELRAIGGGARSDIWMQIKSDILRLPLTTMQVTEATCAGAAILAGSGLGVLSPGEASATWAVPIRTFEPLFDQDMYEERFALYREIYASLSGARHALDAMRD